MLKCNLRQIMAEKKIYDISDLMKQSGLSRGPLSKLHKEVDIETVKIDTLIKLCDTLNCNLSDLIEYVPEKDSFSNSL